MKLADFTYELPNELIARYPAQERSHSRLLCLDKSTGEVSHQQFFNLIDFLKPNDLLVFNNSKVIPARAYGQKSTGGKIEILVERILSEREALVHLRASKSPKPGGLLYFDGVEVEVVAREGDLFHLKLTTEVTWLAFLERVGHMPLPPYIDRDDESFDEERYQTVYANPEGSVAAPTAGLHFDEALIEKIQAKKVDLAFLTLHVGAGTFQPVRVEDIKTHKMHAEFIDVSEQVCEQIKETKRKGGRVIAVGTTTVRSLETACSSGEIKPYLGDTDIFIYPGIKFKCVDAIVTNFHLPESSLLMLVSAFAGYESIKKAYEIAIQERYRFYSYGDAMFIYSGSI